MQATKLQQYLTNSPQKRKLVSIVKKKKNNLFFIRLLAA
jgi:hypothetical protein